MDTCRFGRLLTAMVTPFDEEGGVDYKQAQKLANALLQSGSDGVIVSGTTGECPTLSRDEKLRLFSDIKSSFGDRGAVIAGTGSNSTAQTVELTKEAEQTGVDAVLLVVPYYNRPTQEGLFLHFKAIAEATRLPCILYNVPSRTAVNLDAETTIQLSQIDNIIGIKEASGNLNQCAKIIEDARKGFLVYSGNDQDILPLLVLGGYGVIATSAHLVGIQMKQMILDYVDGKIEDAAAMHRRLLPLFNALFVITNPIPVKYALNYIGFKAGKPRLPLTEPNEKWRAIIEEAVSNSKIDLPTNGNS